jgi:hypothetical protein
LDIPEKRDTDPEANQSLLFASDLYEIPEDDLEREAPREDELAPAGDSVLNYMQSLTPFYSGHHPVSSVLFDMKLIISFCRFSSVSNLTGVKRTNC